MTTEDVIRMAREAGLWVPGFPTEHIERFAALVAKDVLEAAAVECESQWKNVAEKMYGQDCAAAIRALKESIK